MVNQKPKRSVDWNISRRSTASSLRRTRTLIVPTVPLQTSDDALCPRQARPAHFKTNLQPGPYLVFPKQALPVPASKDMRHRRPQITYILEVRPTCSEVWPKRQERMALTNRNHASWSSRQLISTQCTRCSKVSISCQCLDDD